MQNLQIAEKPEVGTGQFIDVVDIWHTIQGEGPYAGVPSVFIRLAGCNLQCPLCDSDYTTGRRKMSVAEINIAVLEKLVGNKTQSVVLTGGEPFRQNIDLLVSKLFEIVPVVQIETNGTLYQELQEFGNLDLTIICSPKTSAVHPKLVDFINCWKYVVEAGQVDEADGLPLSVLGKKCRVARPCGVMDAEGINQTGVYVQPLDDGTARNKDHLQAAVDICLKFGYVLCLQVHKIAGLK